MNLFLLLKVFAANLIALAVAHRCTSQRILIHPRGTHPTTPRPVTLTQWNG
jgi:hypothetical protein